MSIKIYTKTGDQGNTSLIGGTKVSKSDIRIEAYGTVDELNAHIGLCRDLISPEPARAVLRTIQDRLFIIGSSLACDPLKEPKLHIPDLREADVELLENEIDHMQEIIPPLKNFILPGGHPTVSQLHLARCVCRRAERCCVRLNTSESHVANSIIIYLNRLSDYLFVLSRHIAFELNVEEIAWRPKRD